MGILTKGLLYHWELKSSLREKSGLGNDLVLSSGVGNFIDSSVYLDGTQFLKTLTDILSENSVKTYTIGVQLKNITNTTTHCGLLVTGNGASGIGSTCAGIIGNYSNYIVTNGNGDSYNKPITINSSDWVDVVYSYDGQNTKCYVNGINVSTVAGNSRKPTPICLGGYANGIGGLFGGMKGYYKNLVVYKECVLESDICNIFNYSKHIICSNGIYYTIQNDSLFNISDEINVNLIENVGVKLEEITSHIDLLPNEFSVISTSDESIDVTGIKTNKEMIVASNDFLTTIQENIDYFKNESEKVGNGNIKIAFSIDSGLIWKTHNGTDFVDLSIDIPLKEYALLSQDELIKWNLAKEEILLKGIDASVLETLNFNTLTFDKIRFAYVLSVDTSNDIIKNKKLLWQFDSKGSMKQMKDNEFDVSILADSIEFKSLIDNKMVKVNILPNGVAINSNVDVATDTDIDNMFV